MSSLRTGYPDAYYYLHFLPSELACLLASAFKCTSIFLILKAGDYIVRVADNIDLTPCMSPAPLVCPLVKSTTRKQVKCNQILSPTTDQRKILSRKIKRVNVAFIEPATPHHLNEAYHHLNAKEVT